MQFKSERLCSSTGICNDLNMPKKCSIGQRYFNRIIRVINSIYYSNLKGFTRQVIERIARKISRSLYNNILITEQEQEEYEFAIISIIETSLNIGMILLLSLLFHVFVPTLFFLVSFVSLRNRCGGYHFNSFATCFLATIIIYAIIIFITSRIIDIRYYNFATVIASIIILFFGAVNHPNMRYSKEELIAAKESTRVLIILFDIIIVFFNFIISSPLLIIYMDMGVILCSSLLLISKIFKQEVSKYG